MRHDSLLPEPADVASQLHNARVLLRRAPRRPRGQWGALWQLNMEVQVTRDLLRLHGLKPEAWAVVDGHLCAQVMGHWLRWDDGGVRLWHGDGWIFFVTDLRAELTEPAPRTQGVPVSLAASGLQGLTWAQVGPWLLGLFGLLLMTASLVGASALEGFALALATLAGVRLTRAGVNFGSGLIWASGWVFMASIAELIVFAMLMIGLCSDATLRSPGLPLAALLGLGASALVNLPWCVAWLNARLGGDVPAPLPE